MLNPVPLVTFRLTGKGNGVAQTIQEDGSTHVIQTDAHPAFGGGDTAPSPLSYALAPSMSCTQVTSQIVARDRGSARRLHRFGRRETRPHRAGRQARKGSATSSASPWKRRSRPTRTPRCSRASAAKWNDVAP